MSHAAPGRRRRSVRHPSGQRRFTLVEILVVLGILTVLTSLLMGGIRRAVLKAERSRAEAQLLSIKAALSIYENELRHSIVAQQGTSDDELLADHGPLLYAALMNDPDPLLGGGPHAPYVRNQDLEVGLVLDRAVLAAQPMGMDGDAHARRLSPDERDRSNLGEFQRAHAPGGAEPLVFLDPWGNPWHCRAWMAVPTARKNALRASPARREGFGESQIGGAAPVAGPVLDQPHDAQGVDLWSNGPNGVNELGAGDDVRSW
ncbi:MAG: type II secretion system protein [Planctomycetota bacterium]